MWLLISFVLAMGSVAGSIAVLITCEQASEFVAVGVVSKVDSPSLWDSHSFI